MKKKNHPPIFLINKKDRPERLINTINELSKVGLTDYIIRKEACGIERAKELKYEYLNQDIYNNIENNLISCNLLPTWGAVGCAISHIEIWNMMIEENIKYAIIMEDDNKIYDKDKFLWNYNDALKKIKKSEYLSLFISFCSDTKEECKNFIDNNIYTPSTYIIGTSFYFISFCAAKDLLKKIKTVYMQIDLEISNVFLHHNNLDKFKLSIYDNSGIKQDDKFTSDVQYYFITIIELYNLFCIPYEIAEKIHFFLPNDKIFENDLAYNILR
uniref:Glycosyltransferase family 25 n=1 Tax=Mimiviridae sp. ChoanoV1 TaxID=2596887 RepID=A0A5B8HVT1_9VIRU|nr:glycosyltransferase family 25 [Mimiviridae sp. ChoanoV1]